MKTPEYKLQAVVTSKLHLKPTSTSETKGTNLHQLPTRTTPDNMPVVLINSEPLYSEMGKALRNKIICLL